MIAFLLALPAVAAPDTNPPEGSLPPVIAQSDTAAKSGPLVIDAHVPAEVLVDGIKLAQLWYPGSARFDILAGSHVVRVYVSGVPKDIEVDIQPGDVVSVLVGRGGLSVSASPVPPSGNLATVEVELRIVGGGAAQVRLGGEKHPLSGGDRLALTLPPGPYAMSVRSLDGTAIWAAGTLSLVGGAPVVVQIAEGRLPEVNGPARFEPGGG